MSPTFTLCDSMQINCQFRLQVILESFCPKFSPSLFSLLCTFQCAQTYSTLNRRCTYCVVCAWECVCVCLSVCVRVCVCLHVWVLVLLKVFSPVVCLVKQQLDLSCICWKTTHASNLSSSSSFFLQFQNAIMLFHFTQSFFRSLLYFLLIFIRSVLCLFACLFSCKMIVLTFHPFSLFSFSFLFFFLFLSFLQNVIIVMEWCPWALVEFLLILMQNNNNNNNKNNNNNNNNNNNEWAKEETDEWMNKHEWMKERANELNIF